MGRIFIEWADFWSPPKTRDICGSLEAPPKTMGTATNLRATCGFYILLR